mgnify:CR=1 FL=1|jgi:ABC-type sugar transport systems, ATPase components
MARVKLEQLTKQYQDARGRQIRAVHGIDLEVRDGEFMVLVGPSGCGKSTTLRMIAGLEEISAGTVSIGDRVVNDVLPKDRDIAMVFQNYALYPHMNVYENMAFGLKLRKMARAEIDARVREAAAMLGLETYLARKPKELSGGQRQRVAVGRAIVRKPKVFLFDEPLSNLDAKMRAATRMEISKLHARLGATMIYVTHDQLEAMTMGDRICVMKDGRIMQTAEPLELYHRPANMFVAGFIGSPPMNFFTGTIRDGADGREFVAEGGAADTLRVPIPEESFARGADLPRRVVMGIRPEDIKVEGDGLPKHGAAVVELAEAMGAETLVHLAAGSLRCVARVEAACRVRPGEKVRLSFSLAKVCWFDPATEERLV